MRLQFTPQYPATPPTAHFITKIFHPNIAPRTGEVCVNTLKRDWNSKVTLSEILMVFRLRVSTNKQTIKSLLIDPNPTSALNEEAGKLLLEEYPAYCSHARLFTEVHAMRPKPLVIPPKLSPCKTNQGVRDESRPRSTSGSNIIPLSLSQAQNAPTPEETPERKLLLFGIGLKRSDNEDGENRPAKRSQGFRRAGKGDLRRL